LLVVGFTGYSSPQLSQRSFDHNQIELKISEEKKKPSYSVSDFHKLSSVKNYLAEDQNFWRIKSFSTNSLLNYKITQQIYQSNSSEIIRTFLKIPAKDNYPSSQK
jgi:hypothetical protein